jgi:hypothetical protein
MAARIACWISKVTRMQVHALVLAPTPTRKSTYSPTRAHIHTAFSTGFVNVPQCYVTRTHSPSCFTFYSTHEEVN